MILAAELVDFDNDRGESLLGVLLHPDPPPSMPAPAVILLHGSGGLFSTPDRNDTKLEVGHQFSDWASLLLDRGYSVLLPSSFYSRGYFEWDDRPRPKADETERMVMRVHDAYGALRFACGLGEVECARVGLVGFSNGASVTMLAQHEGLDGVSGMSTLTPAAERDRFASATAFYPGCAFQGLLEPPYFPTSPVDVYHAERDPIREHCPTRLAEVQDESERRMVDPTPMTLRIYDGADHGFDGDPRNDAERAARDDARRRTLERLDDSL